jgi:steroid delta-isomerase-like uncharacterized protein
MSSQESNKKENIKLVQKFYDCLNKNDLHQLHAFDAMVSQNVQFHDPSMPNATSGLQSLKQSETNYVTAFPNKSIKLDTIFGAEDRVVVRWTVNATHKGQFQGIAPTNKPIKLSGITIYRIADNKICEIWRSWDLFNLYEQLGVARQQLVSR